MSVLIKGMRMPKNCTYCDSIGLNVAIGCPVMTGINGRATDCPLVEIPPHGRLIDVDALKLEYGMKDDCNDCEREMRGSVKACEYDTVYTKMNFCEWLDDAPTVIEAEEDQEE